MLSLRRWRHLDLRPIRTGGEAGATQCDFPVDARRARQLGDNVAIRELWVVQRILQFQDGCGRHADGREALLPRRGIGARK